MIKAAIIGYGNIGKASVEAISAAPDFELTGVVSGHLTAEEAPELCGCEIVRNVENLTVKPDVAIICTPTRAMPDMAVRCLNLGINTVDSFDMHAHILEARAKLQEACVKNGKTAVLSAGWDPGSDSMVRALMEAAAPKGITYTNFGPGMSMGHSVAAKALDGVKDALSMTIPLGTGIHRRMVYVELEEGYTLEDVTARLKADEYFAHDETHVMAVDDINQLKDVGHGVYMVRKGVSGTTHNQIFSFDMKINNPALTSQLLVSVARAGMKQAPGCYTMIELPLIDMLYGEKDDLIRRLV